VITTRTVAAVEDSRAIAEKALPKIVIGGQPPHTAVRDVISTSSVSMVAGRWATTVISVQYEIWSALAPEERNVEDLESAGDFPMRMDRTEAFAVIERYLTARLSGSASAAHVVMWKGPPEQGLDVFARRFADFVEERYSDWNSCRRKIELQLGDRANNSESHYLSCIYLGLTGRGVIPDDFSASRMERIRRVLRRIITRPQTILLLLHGPFTEANLNAVREYLKFWEGLPDALGLVSRDVHVVLASAFLQDEKVQATYEPSEHALLVELGKCIPSRSGKAFELIPHFVRFKDRRCV
jgi:hypothetical protein